VTPFNTNLGVLESVTLQWTFDALFAVVTSGAGNAGLNFGGKTRVGGIIYGGNGTGGGNGTTSSESLTMVPTPMSSSSTFTAAQAGPSYNPAIWAILTGSSAYSAKWTDGGSYFSYQNIASGSFASDLGLVVSYNHTPSPVPEPASALGTLGLLAGGTFFRRRKQAA
jgi:PEP-CTERM motif